MGGLQGCYLSLDHVEEDGFGMHYLDDSAYKEPYTLARVYRKNLYHLHGPHCRSSHVKNFLEGVHKDAGVVWQLNMQCS